MRNGTGRLAERARTVLSADGPLARRMPGFTPRPGQVALSTRWADAIEGNRVLVAEASTGIGKTIAYLLPAILSGRRVVVATGTKTLQSQVLRKDLPALRGVLPEGTEAALLKGRSNYLCRKAVESFLRRPNFRPGEERHFVAVADFCARTATGDLSECHGVPETASVWTRLSAKGETCDGRQCPRAALCFVARAKERAAAADVAVVNHHLLLSSLRAEAEGARGTVPRPDVLVLDEAHGLAGAAMDVFGHAVSSSQAMDAVYATPEIYALGGAVREAGNAFRDAVRALFDATPREGGRKPLDPRRLLPLAEAVLADGRAFRDAIAREATGNERLRVEAETARQSLDSLLSELSAVMEPAEGTVAWSETSGRRTTLRRASVDAAEPLARHLWSLDVPILVASATLAVNGDMAYFLREAGLADVPRVETMTAHSDFDYAGRTVFYVPTSVPEPRDPAFPAKASDEAARVAKAAGGGCLALCTSHAVMNAMAKAMRASVPHPVLMQGEAPREKTLEDFRSDRDSVLVATGSFWEGVDVPGESLRCLVIDKLPFAPPDDPVVAAKSDLVRRRGGNPFSEFQLPEAVLALRQGVGRLMRSHEDYGAVAILDRRILDKGYGAVVRKSLPDAPWTRDPAEIPALLRRLSGEATARAAKTT